MTISEHCIDAEKTVVSPVTVVVETHPVIVVMVEVVVVEMVIIDVVVVELEIVDKEMELVVIGTGMGAANIRTILVVADMLMFVRFVTVIIQDHSALKE